MAASSDCSIGDAMGIGDPRAIHYTTNSQCRDPQAEVLNLGANVEIGLNPVLPASVW